MILLVTTIGHARSASCDCADLTAIKNRLRQSQAAIAAYRFQFNLITSQEKHSGPIMAKKENYLLSKNYPNSLESRVEQAIEEVTKTANADLVKSETDASCNIVIAPTATACMRAGRTVHESVHVQACKGLRGYTDINYWTNERLADLALEEIRGWEAERTFLLDQLKQLSGKCPGTQWSGVVSAVESAEVHESTDEKPLTAHDHPIHHQNDYDKTLTTTVTVADDLTISTGNFEEHTKRASDTVVNATCHGSLFQKNAIEQPSHTEEASITFGSATSIGRFSPSISGSGYTITAKAPQINATHDVSIIPTPTFCGDPPQPQAPTPSSTIQVGGDAFSASGKIGNPSILEGETTKTVPITNGTLTTHITWQLYRTN